MQIVKINGIELQIEDGMELHVEDGGARIIVRGKPGVEHRHHYPAVPSYPGYWYSHQIQPTPIPSSPFSTPIVTCSDPSSSAGNGFPTSGNMCVVTGAEQLWSTYTVDALPIPDGVYTSGFAQVQ